MSHPVPRSDRVVGLDVLRGLAIFGILVVNVEQMFFPLFLAESPVAMIPEERGTWLAWGVTDALFRIKFITVFSLLFGAGFALQWLRSSENSKAFRRLYLRRLFVLVLFGLVHGLLFYMADVLVVYALTALGLFMVRRWPGRRLLWAGSVLFFAMVAWHVVISGPGKKDAERPERQRAIAQEVARMRTAGTVRLAAAELGPLNTLDFTDEVRHDQALSGGAQMLEDGRIQLAESEYALPMPAWLAIVILDGNNGEEQAKVEYAVYSQGPLRAAVFARSTFLLKLLVLYTPFYLGWRTLALFMIGAGCVKLGLLAEGREALWRRVAKFGLGAGLPISCAATILRGMAWSRPGQLTYAGNLLQDVSSVLIAAGLAGLVFLWCRQGTNGPAGALQRGLASVGRTALSNYFGQSVVTSLIATSYGLGLFGDLSRLQILILAVVCFGVQIGISHAWLRRFRRGPLEWVWRSLTYCRRLSLRDRTTAA